MKKEQDIDGFMHYAVLWPPSNNEADRTKENMETVEFYRLL
jgi:hypothetical protein